jgi:hypothetical protein
MKTGNDCCLTEAHEQNERHEADGRNRMKAALAKLKRATVELELEPLAPHEMIRFCVLLVQIEDEAARCPNQDAHTAA